MKYDTKIVLAYFKQMGLPIPELEYRFHPTRKFRFDFAWPEHRLALEVEGGIFTRQAHGSIKGMLRDIEKYNLAQMNGWHVLRVIPGDLCMLKTVKMIKATMQSSEK